MHDSPPAKPDYFKGEDSQSEALKSIQEMLRTAASSQPPFPPTLLYNEGWLLRLVLNWFAGHSLQDHPLSFAAGATWFSEALLPSAFLARRQGDPLAESWTHADGVIGHFQIGKRGKGDLSLKPGNSQFLVLEAKMFSTLSPGVTHASYFDQAARTVACMAEVLRRAELHPSKLATLGFYTLAPSSQIEKGVFSNEMEKDSIFAKVEQRVKAYEGDKNRWFEEWFQPVWDSVIAGCLSWEGLIAAIQGNDPPTGKDFEAFYKCCQQFGS